MNSGRLLRAAAACAVASTCIASASSAPGAPAAPGFAQGTPGPRPMTLVDLAEVPRVLDPQLSPDGTFIAYSLARADWKANRQVSHIWRQSTRGGAPVQLGFIQSGETTARWSPDGKRLLFLARPDGDATTQLHVVAGDGGNSRVLTHHVTAVASPAWAPDGSTIYFIAPDDKTHDERERERVRGDVYAYDEAFKQRHLWKVDVETGAERRLTSGDWSVLAFRLSRDGRQIVVHRAPSPRVSDAVRSEVWLVDSSGERWRALTHNSIEENEAELSPDGTRVMFLADANAEQQPYFNSTLFVVSSAGGPVRAVVPDFPYAIDHASWSNDGLSIVASVNMGVHSEIFKIGLDGRTKQLTDGEHSVQFWSVSPAAGQMVFQLDEPTRIGDVWTLPLAGGTPSRITGLYDALGREFRLPRQEKMQWRGADGTSIEGVLMYPLDYQVGRRYPLVVQLHGGPAESDKFGAGPGFIVNYFPVLAAKGYAVLRPNYRGSAGYGNAFYRDPVGGYFKNQHLDVLAGVDALVARGIADPDRLAVMGWSAGAHLTNKLITFTDRFKAASSTAGVANWTSMYAQTDIRDSRTVWFGGTPWELNAPTNVYWDHSPLKDVARVKTPTLFIVGENDARVPMAQSIEMFRALRSNGVETRLYVGPREGHQWTELRHQLFKANAELEWFDKYVLHRDYTWETPPAD